MMIMTELKLAFIHIYKTGGTSLTHILAPHTDPAFREGQTRERGDGFQGTWHFRGVQHAKFNSAAGGFPPRLRDKVDNWRFLAVVRDPYSWSHSVYKEFFGQDRGGVRGSSFLFGKVKPERTLEDFYEFVRDFMPGYSHEIGLGTQTSFVRGIPREQLHLIRFENYEADVRRVLPELGIEVDDLPHDLNRGQKKRREAEALLRSPEHVAFVNEVYAEDFRSFGYEMVDPQRAG
ncbi:hypothetical protein GE300_08055 [Rhodobacteraceae bacterium 2CG4]|uniref:Sulfotransferase family protein n=1 Tax=Halovulum marinum TaxID=2662447 RepID=A0A6L5YZD3_9RHOB|nr:sulfotransferase family 2 domain-containing protein [Halovulum marinum]MSU89568.1 hypothetical protein [Halovulum marinum]